MRPTRMGAWLCAVIAVSVFAPVAVSAAQPDGGETPGGGAPRQGRYIVHVRDDANPGAMAAEASTAGDQVEHVFTRALRGYSGRLSEGRVRALRNDPRIEAVVADEPISVATRQASPPSWGLDRIDQRNLPLDAGFTYTETGAGVRAYVFDTGIRATHNEVRGRVLGGYNAVPDGRNTDDCNGHGTHVSGTIGGTTVGVAKSVSLVPVRVLDCAGNGLTSYFAAGVDWMLRNHPAGTPAVGNASLGGNANTTSDTAVTSAVTQGVTMVVAAGNNNSDACAKSPARAPAAVTVGATSSNDQRWSGSNWGTCLDVFAPGENIKSAYHTTDSATATGTGTSMATPHVAGAVALLLHKEPGLSPAAVADRLALRATSGLVGSPGTGSPNRLLYVPPAAPTVTAPAGLTALAGDAQVTVSWSANPADQEILRYTLYTAQGGVETALDVQAGECAATCTRTVTLANGPTYTFAVTASNASGTGPRSASVSARPLPLPLTPGGLAVTATGTTLSVEWTPNAAGQFIDSYTVYWQSDGGSEQSRAVAASTCTASGCTTTFTGAQAATRHQFRVTATNGRGESARSRAVRITPEPATATPEIVGAVEQVKGALVTWMPVEDSAVERYVLRAYRESDGEQAAEVLWDSTMGVDAAGRPAGVIDGLERGVYYQITVTARTAAGDSEESRFSNRIKPL